MYELHLKEARNTRKLSIEKLAKKSGVGKGTISDIENGHQHPKLKTICRIAKAMNIKIDNELFKVK